MDEAVPGARGGFLPPPLATAVPPVIPEFASNRRRLSCAQRCARRARARARGPQELARPSRLCLGVEGASLTVFACSFFAPRPPSGPQPHHWHISKERQRPGDVHPHAAEPKPSTIAVLVDGLRPFCHQIRAAR